MNVRMLSKRLAMLAMLLAAMAASSDARDFGGGLGREAYGRAGEGLGDGFAPAPGIEPREGNAAGEAPPDSAPLQPVQPELAPAIENVPAADAAAAIDSVPGGNAAAAIENVPAANAAAAAIGDAPVGNAAAAIENAPVGNVAAANAGAAIANAPAANAVAAIENVPAANAGAALANVPAANAVAAIENVPAANAGSAPRGGIYDERGNYHVDGKRGGGNIQVLGGVQVAPSAGPTWAKSAARKRAAAAVTSLPCAPQVIDTGSTTYYVCDDAYYQLSYGPNGPSYTLVTGQ